MLNVISKNNDNKIKKLKKKKNFSICISFVFKKFGNKKIKKNGTKNF